MIRVNYVGKKRRVNTAEIKATKEKKIMRNKREDKET